MRSQIQILNAFKDTVELGFELALQAASQPDLASIICDLQVTNMFTTTEARENGMQKTELRAENFMKADFQLTDKL